MKKIVFILLTLSISPVYADEVFKCQQKSGKTVYQSLPCESSEKQKAIEIPKPDPGKMAEEEAKLKAWEEDFAKREEARLKAEKELQAEYQRQQDYETKRQAGVLERQNMENSYPYQFFPYYPSYQHFRVYRPSMPHQQNIIKEKTFPVPHQPEQNGIKPDRKTDTGLKKPGFD